MSSNERTKKVQIKRIDIKNELEKAGHFVRYAEDLVDPNLPTPQNNAILQEIVIMKEFDLIFCIVDSPGSITEASVISLRPHLSRKASLYLDKEYIKGLTADACRLAEINGAEFKTFNYPQDLDECNLLGFVKERVGKAQFLKLTL